MTRKAEQHPFRIHRRALVSFETCALVSEEQASEHFMGMPNAYLPFLVNKDGRTFLHSA